MYAVITTGGKQYKVAKGQTLKIETLPAEIGGIVQFPVLMMVDDTKTTLGTPHISDCVVSAEVVSHGRGKKIKIIKMRRRKHYRKQQGHRQNYTELEILGING